MSPSLCDVFFKFETHDQQIKISHISLLNMLKVKLQSIPYLFSYQFNMIGQIGTDYFGGDENNFRFASDVKISKLFNIILVCDCGNKRIQIYDLYSKEYVNTVKILTEPVKLCVDGQDLYVTCRNNSVQKFNLKNQLELSDHRCIWKSSQSFLFLNDIAMCHTIERFPNLLEYYQESSSKLLFVCDTENDRIVVLNPVNGKLVTSFSSILLNNETSMDIKKPLSIAFNNLGECFISTSNELLCILDDKLINRFSFNNSNENIKSICIDRDVILIVCNDGDDGYLAKKRGNDSFSICHRNETGRGGSGCCFGINGQLLVVDWFRVRIYI